MIAENVAAPGEHEGLEAKIEAIRDFYTQSQTHADVRALAEQLSFDEAGRLNVVAFFARLKAMTRYLSDPSGVEMIKAPWAMVEQIHEQGYAVGDCDDLATLAYVLLKMVGIEAALEVGWLNGAASPGHIFVGVPQKDGTYAAFDLVTNAYGARLPGITGVRAYA